MPYGHNARVNGDLRTVLRCGFCGKAENEVAHLVVGMDASICGECAREALDVLPIRSTPAATDADKAGDGL